MKLIERTFVAALCCLAAPLAAAEPAPLSEILKATQAVAYIRVIHVSDDLRDNLVRHTATLVVCGRAYGLDSQTELVVPFGVPSKPEAPKPEDEVPAFFVGYRCIVLLARHDERWETLQQLNVSTDGRFQEERVGSEIGLQPGLEANEAVKLIEEVLKKNAPRPTQRPVTPPPLPRNEPWNIFRASPLRRIWPFFPF